MAAGACAVAAVSAAGAAVTATPPLFSLVGMAMKFFTGAPSAAFQIRTSPSQLPVAISFASRLNVAA